MQTPCSNYFDAKQHGLQNRDNKAINCWDYLILLCANQSPQRAQYKSDFTTYRCCWLWGKNSSRVAWMLTCRKSHPAALKWPLLSVSKTSSPSLNTAVAVAIASLPPLIHHSPITLPLPSTPLSFLLSFSTLTLFLSLPPSCLAEQWESLSGLRGQSQADKPWMRLLSSGLIRVLHMGGPSAQNHSRIHNTTAELQPYSRRWNRPEWHSFGREICIETGFGILLFDSREQL